MYNSTGLLGCCVKSIATSPFWVIANSNWSVYDVREAKKCLANTEEEGGRESAYFSDPSRVEQHTFTILHKLEKVAASNLHGAKGSQQGSKHIALWIRTILPFLQITLQIHSTIGG